jgi:hypothetical protein
MEDVGIFYGHFVYFMDILYILLSFCIFCGNLVYFSRFGILYQEQFGNPDVAPLGSSLLWPAIVIFSVRRGCDLEYECPEHVFAFNRTAVKRGTVSLKRAVATKDFCPKVQTFVQTAPLLS